MFKRFVVCTIVFPKCTLRTLLGFEMLNFQNLTNLTRTYFSNKLTATAERRKLLCVFVFFTVYSLIHMCTSPVYHFTAGADVP